MLRQRQDTDKYYRKWIGIVCDAMSCLDKEGARWVQLPCDGGYYDQDEWIFKIWEQIRVSYVNALNDEKIQKELAKIGKGC